MESMSILYVVIPEMPGLAASQGYGGYTGSVKGFAREFTLTVSFRMNSYFHSFDGDRTNPDVT